MDMITKHETEKLILINIIEGPVRAKVDELIENFDMCRCEQCRINACAIALNHLPPHYVTTEKGAVLGKLSESKSQHPTNLAIEVTKALLIVKGNPLH